MAFSTPQQITFRRVVADAWRAHCRREPGLDAGDRVAMDVWRRQLMHRAAGVYSTKDASPTRDFVPILAAFEAVAGNSIHWQQRLEGDRLRRVTYALDKLMAERDVDPAYVQGIARQMFDTAALDRLTAEQLEKIITALKRHLGIYHGPATHRGNQARKEALARAA